MLSWNSVLSQLRCNVWRVSRNIIPKVARYIVHTVAVTVRRYYQVRSFILNLSRLNKNKYFLTLLLIILISGCNRPVSTPTPDLFATLQASTPSSFASPLVTQQAPTPDFSFSPPTFTAIPQGAIPSPSPADQLTGH